MQSVLAAIVTQRACRRHYVPLDSSFMMMCYVMLGVANAFAQGHEGQEKAQSPTAGVSARQDDAMCCSQWENP